MSTLPVLLGSRPERYSKLLGERGGEISKVGEREEPSSHHPSARSEQDQLPKKPSPHHPSARSEQEQLPKKPSPHHPSARSEQEQLPKKPSPHQPSARSEQEQLPKEPSPHHPSAHSEQSQLRQQSTLHHAQSRDQPVPHEHSLERIASRQISPIDLPSDEKNYAALREALGEHCAGRKKLPPKAEACLARAFFGSERPSLLRRALGKGKWDICTLASEDLRKLKGQKAIQIQHGEVDEPADVQACVNDLLERFEKLTPQKRRAIVELAARIVDATLVPVALLTSAAHRLIALVDYIDQKTQLSRSYHFLSVATIFIPYTLAFPRIHNAYLIFTSITLFLRAVPNLSGERCAAAPGSRITRLQLLMGYFFSSIAVVATWLLLDFLCGNLGLFGILRTAKTVTDEKDGHMAVIVQLIAQWTHGVTEGFSAMISRILYNIFFYILEQFGKIEKTDVWKSRVLRIITGFVRHREEHASATLVEEVLNNAPGIVEEFNTLGERNRARVTETEERSRFRAVVLSMSHEVSSMFRSNEEEGGRIADTHFADAIMIDAKKASKLVQAGDPEAFVLRLRESIPAALGMRIVGALCATTYHDLACRFAHALSKSAT